MMNDRMDGLWFLVAVILGVAVLGLTLAPAVSAEQNGTFTGTWITSGKWEPIEFKKGREVFTFRLAGRVNLKTEPGEVTDFRSECAGLWDSATGSTVRCAWKETGGKDAVYLVLSGQMLQENMQVSGEFAGGSGKFESLTGNISFTWSSIFRNQTEGILTSHTENLKGAYRIP